MANQLTKIPKFRRCVLQNFPFIEQDFDALTDYELLCKVVVYLNKVIANENSLTESQANLIIQFNTLKDYVDNYFDNLDVQEEINNKLDEMAEAGTLQEIITTYIQSNVAWTFDTVADMKQATNLVAGSYAQTLGFHTINDGGGALYYVTDTGTANEIDIIAINSLYANLVSGDSIDIKQLGAKGDNTTNITAILNYALANWKKINIPSGNYIINKFQSVTGNEIKGCGKPVLKLTGEGGVTAPLVSFVDNVRVDGVIFDCQVEDLNWNRGDIYQHNNIRITDCSFNGFRSSNGNGWGLLLTGCKNIVIKDCYFDNNTQSDIAIVAGCENITIDSCSGSSFYVNIEPDSNPEICDILIVNCDLARLNVLENQFIYTTLRNLTVLSCTIDLLQYDGGTAIFENCIIKDVIPQNKDGAGGIVSFINSLNFSENLLDDPYLDNFGSSSSAGTSWYLFYTPSSISQSLSFNKVGEENVLTINPNNTATAVTIEHKSISVTYGKRYLIKIRGGANYPTGAGSISKVCRFEWLNSSDVVLETAETSMFRGGANSIVPIHTECAVITPPEDATKLRVRLRNSSYGTGSFSIASVELFEIKDSTSITTNLVDLPINTKRIFNGTTPNTAMNYKKGDIMYYTEPSTYVGKVCTTDTYSGTWKDFGALAA